MNTSTAAKKRPANRLKDATSPYLLQHAHNPVDWYPWGEEAFATARREEKLVFLSVGYSACHWCHVMERECFENEALAKLLNEHFVAIKVDREERPDIDDLYMRYVHLTGQGGGWPMSVFLTPDAEPFYAGTYFPPGRFAQLLTSLAEAWSGQREKVVEAAHAAAEGLRQYADVEYREPERPLSAETTASAIRMLEEHFDWESGGLQAPRKFPPHATLEWLLDRVERTSEETVERRMLTLTLDRMQLGGIHDHVGGGFHRYATDREWFVPHFEKMLYDNAQLARVYARAAVVLRHPAYATTARGICDWVLREMTSPDGAFYSSLDADSEGVEGRFYVWSAAEVGEVLGAEAGAFKRWYGVTESGNYHEEATGVATGWNIPFLASPLPPQDEARAAEWRQRLLEARNRRVRPHLDDKVLAGWNALMIGSLAEAGRQLQERRYVAAAEVAAGFLLEHLRTEAGRWQASWRKGRVSGQATLDDHAYLAAAFLDLHEATGKIRWKDEAVTIVGLLDRHFRDEKRGGYFLVADDHEKLLARIKNPADNAIPSGNGIAAQVLVRLAKEAGDTTARKRAGELFNAFHALMDLAPLQVESLLRGLDAAEHDGWFADTSESGPKTGAKIQRGPVIAELILGQDRLVAGRRAPVAARLSIDPGYHVQGAEGSAGVTSPTRLRIVSRELGELQGVRYPLAGTLTLPEIGAVSSYEGGVLITGWLAVPANAPPGLRTLRLEVDFQPCRGDSCEAPQTVVLSKSIEVVERNAAAQPLNEEVFRGLEERP